ncbi:MAG: hypothetical protein WA853_17250, partial [Candidatus Acidiferrum sp.]
CQAFLLAADSAATDPVCSLAPQRPKVDAILAAVAQASACAPTISIKEVENTPLAGIPESVSHRSPAETKPDWLYRPSPT